MCNVRKVDLTISSYQKIYKSYDLNIIAWPCHNMYVYMLIRTCYDLNIIAWLDVVKEQVMISISSLGYVTICMFTC